MRIAIKGSEQDWFQFLSDYWLPVCRFAQQQTQLGIEDAEDVAEETFEAVFRNQLLQRWISDRSSKLRTLICTVVKHILSSRARAQEGRQRLLQRDLHELLRQTELSTIKGANDSVEYLDGFYTAWAESILLQALESLMQEYKSNSRIGYFSVLHGRICEGMTVAQTSKAVGIKTYDVQNYYKAARRRLRTKLMELVREHIRRYCGSQDLDAEFDSEWHLLGQYLKKHGGLEQAIAKVYKTAGFVEIANRCTQAVTSAACRLAKEVPKLRELSVERLRRNREQKQEPLPRVNSSDDKTKTHGF